VNKTLIPQEQFIERLEENSDFISIAEEARATYERLKRMRSGPKLLRGISTGFPALDNILSGLHQSDFVAIAARPSYGKTALALDLTLHAAKEGYAVGIFSLEASKEQLMDRIVANQASIPLWRIRTGRLNGDADLASIRRTLDAVAKTKLYIDETACPTILEMREKAHRLQRERGLDLLVVDCIQFIQPRIVSDSPARQMTEIARGLKLLAQELDIPIVAVSQLATANAAHRTPRLSCLRESSLLDQYADVVLFLYRKDRETMEISEEAQNVVEVLVAKHRRGPMGMAALKFDPETVRFRAMESRKKASFTP